MKNLLKKIGVFSLIIAVLAPFIELPSVNAAEKQCTDNLNNYLFLDVGYFKLEDEKTFLDNYSETNGGYTTYTQFQYNFPNNETNSIKITNSDTNTFNGSNIENGLDSYWNYFNEIRDSLESYSDTNKNGNILTQTAGFKGSYDNNAIILHGKWEVAYDENDQLVPAKWEDVEYGDAAHSIQDVLKDEDLSKLSVSITAASFTNKTFKDLDTKANYSYFQKVVDNNSNVWTASDGTKYIPIAINRTIKQSEAELETMLNGYTFGYEEEDGDIVVYTTSDASEISDIADSYTAFKTYYKNESTLNMDDYIQIFKKADADIDDVDFDTTKPYYWPATLNVEYQVCSKEVQKWTLEYDDNVDDASVIDTPASQTESLGTNIVITSKTPSRNGYTFNGWCTEKDGSGKCYKAGETYESPSESTTKLVYAQWAQTGTEDNKKTGIVSYILGFAAVGIVASGIYLVSKKKNLFKQI